MFCGFYIIIGFYEEPFNAGFHVLPYIARLSQGITVADGERHLDLFA